MTDRDESALAERSGTTWPTPVALHYPNGRVHETVVEFALELGARFELYGRAWTAERWTQHGRGVAATAIRRIICKPPPL